MNEVVLFVKGTAALGAITMMDLWAVANTAVSTANRSIFSSLTMVAAERFERRVNRGQ